MLAVSILPQTEELRSLHLPEIFVLEKRPCSCQLHSGGFDGSNRARLLNKDRDYWLIVIHRYDLGDRSAQGLDRLIRRAFDTLQMVSLARS